RTGENPARRALRVDAVERAARLQHHPHDVVAERTHRLELCPVLSLVVAVGRQNHVERSGPVGGVRRERVLDEVVSTRDEPLAGDRVVELRYARDGAYADARGSRSEEHTSELQSRE